jgi:hypothetical protein
MERREAEGRGEMSIEVASVIAAVSLGGLAMATYEMANPVWRYSRDRGLYVERGPDRSRLSQTVSVLVLVVVFVVPQLLMLSVAVDPSQPTGSRLLGAAETVMAAVWLGVLGWRAIRARGG